MKKKEEEKTTVENTVQNNKTEADYLKEMKNEIKNNMLFPKLIKIRTYNPLETLFMFVITLCIVCTFVIFGNYVYVYGLDSLFAGYEYDDEMTEKYEELISNYQQILDDYKNVISANSIAGIYTHNSDYDDVMRTLADYEAKITSYTETMDEQAQLIEKYEALLEENDISIDDKIGKTDKDNEDTFYIYCSDAKRLDAEELVKTAGLEDENVVIVTVDYFDIENSFEALLSDPDNEAYPDLIFMEPDMKEQFLDFTDVLTSDDLDIDKEVWDSYGFAKRIGSTEETVSKIGKKKNVFDAFYYSIAPGYIQVRADMAEEYFDTTDPDEIYDNYFCDLATFLDTAMDINAQSKGKVALISSASEIDTMLKNNMEDLTPKEIESIESDFEEYAYDVEMWGADWMDLLYGDAKKKDIIASLGSPWFSEFLSKDTVFDDNNMILVKAPVEYSWGGTGVIVPEGCHNTELASELINILMTDVDFGLSINEKNGEILNNPNIMSEKDFDYNLDDYVYDKQDYLNFIDDICQ